MNQQSYISLYILWRNLLPLVQREECRQWKWSLGSSENRPDHGSGGLDSSNKSTWLVSQTITSSHPVQFRGQPSIGWSRKRKNGCFQASSVRKLHLLVNFAIQIKGYILPWPSQGAREAVCLVVLAISIAFFDNLRSARGNQKADS